MIPPLVPIGLFVSGQPQGYTLVLSPTQYFSAAPWMNVKSIYMKAESNRLYWYIEYAGVMPSDSRSYRNAYVYMDTDKTISTGGQYNGRGMDYYLYFYLYGDNSSSYVRLYKWNATSQSYGSQPTTVTGLTRKSGLDYLEVWVDQQAAGYSAQGLYFYIDHYADTTGVTDASGEYIMGSHQRSITLDGNAGDWGDTPASITFPALSTVPAELEASAFCIANDQDNLYFRIDMRGTPTKSIEAGKIRRNLYVYVDTDDNNATGHLSTGGSEYELYLSSYTGVTRSGYVTMYRYVGTGEDWNFEWMDEGDATVAHDNTFEALIPLTKLGLGASGKIHLYIEDNRWYLSDTFPRPAQYVAFPAVQSTTGDLGIVKLFGSETVFLTVVVGLMLVEAVLVFIIARRGKKQGIPPPP